MKKDFPWTQAEFREMTRAAVSAYWTTRTNQQKAQVKRKTTDAGTRGAVTGGKHLDALSGLIVRVILEAGFNAKDIHCDNALILPGYYRAQKNGTSSSPATAGCMRPSN